MAEKKRSNKLSVIVFSAIALFLVVLVALLIFADTVIAYTRLSSVEKTAEGATVVILRDPLVSDGINYTATEKILRGGDAAEMRENFLSSVNGRSFDRSEDALTGDWDIQIEFMDDQNKRSSFYLLEDSFYISKDGKRSYFKVKDSCIEEYRKVYEEIFARTRLDSK